MVVENSSLASVPEDISPSLEVFVRGSTWNSSKLQTDPDWGRCRHEEKVGKRSELKECIRLHTEGCSQPTPPSNEAHQGLHPC